MSGKIYIEIDIGELDEESIIELSHFLVKMSKIKKKRGD